MVEESDECGNLGYQDKGIIFRTKPEDRDEQFSDFGCSNHEFVEEDGVSGPKCPYHKPGGLKEQLIKQRIRQEKAKAKSQRREERKKLDGEEGCCIVQ